MSNGLYVHIPFCHVKCRFCHFAAYPGLLKEIPRYLSALEKEMRRHLGENLETLFIGGGTPTVLDADGLRTLLESLRRSFILEPGCEATVECNPESVSQEKLEVLKAGGVNRLSFGLQAAQDSLLKALGRTHDFACFDGAYRLARSRGFGNLNIDLMYGLPGQTLADWKETLETVVKYEPEHLSAYALFVEEKTAFNSQGVETDEDLQADMYEALAEFLTGRGYVHYEISNFARPGFESRHNKRYWKNRPCLAVGASAAGYDGNVRSKNTERVGDYVLALEQGQSAVIEEVRLSEEERIGEDLMLGLRLKEGAGVSARARGLYGKVLEKYASLGFLKDSGPRVTPTLKGWLLSNRMFQELLSPAG